MNHWSSPFISSLLLSLLMDDHVQVWKKKAGIFFKDMHLYKYIYISTLNFKREEKGKWRAVTILSFSIWAEIDSLRALIFLIFLILFFLLFGPDFSPPSPRFLYFLAVTADGQSNDCASERKTPLYLFLLSRRSPQEKNRWQFDQRLARRGRQRKPSCVHTFFVCVCLLLHLVSFFSFFRWKQFSFYSFTLLPQH